MREAKPAVLILASSSRLLPSVLLCFSLLLPLHTLGCWLAGCTCGDGRVSHGRTPPPSLAVCLAYILVVLYFDCLHIRCVSVDYSYIRVACLVVSPPAASG